MIGSGPVAQVFVKLLSLLGVETIIGIARSEEKRQLLLENGATAALNSGAVAVAETIRNLYPSGVDYVLDTVGSAEIVNQAMELIKDRGEILCYGVPANNQMQLDWSKAPYNWKLNFQQMPSKLEEGEAYEQVVAWIREGKLDMKSFISDYFAFDDILYAFEKYMNREVVKKRRLLHIKLAQFDRFARSNAHKAAEKTIAAIKVIYMIRKGQVECNHSSASLRLNSPTNCLVWQPKITIK